MISILVSACTWFQPIPHNHNGYGVLLQRNLSHSVLHWLLVVWCNIAFIFAHKRWLIHVAYGRADSRFAPNQLETALLCSDVCHWLGTNLDQPRYGIIVRFPPQIQGSLVLFSDVHVLFWPTQPWNPIVAMVPNLSWLSADYRFAPSQRETSLQSNAVSH